MLYLLEDEIKRYNHYEDASLYAYCKCIKVDV